MYASSFPPNSYTFKLTKAHNQIHPLIYKAPPPWLFFFGGISKSSGQEIKLFSRASTNCHCLQLYSNSNFRENVVLYLQISYRNAFLPKWMIPCEKWYHSAKLLCVALNDTLGELYAGGGGGYIWAGNQTPWGENMGGAFFIYGGENLPSEV